MLWNKSKKGLQFVTALTMKCQFRNFTKRKLIESNCHLHVDWSAWKKEEIQLVVCLCDAFYVCKPITQGGRDQFAEFFFLLIENRFHLTEIGVAF